MVPLRLGIVVIGIPPPGDGGHNLTVNHRIGVQHLLSNDTGHLLEEVPHPGLQFTLGGARLHLVLQILRPQVNEDFHRADVAALLQRVAVRQLISQGLGVFQQNDLRGIEHPYKQHGHHQQPHPKFPAAPPGAAASLCHPVSLQLSISVVKQDTAFDI